MVLAVCPSCGPDVQVDLTARVECGPGGGIEIAAEVRADPADDLVVQIVSQGRMLASRHVHARPVREELAPFTPVFHGDASPRAALAVAVARARDAASGKVLAETGVRPLAQLCW